jgi:EAL and modified HD-GYP domain-containing signal transduction protein
MSAASVPDVDPAARPFPMARLQPVANARNEWVAVTLQLSGEPAAAGAGLAALFGLPDMEVRSLLAPLDCIVSIADPQILGASVLELLPPTCVMFSIPPDACGPTPAEAPVGAEGGHTTNACRRLQGEGYRVLAEGPDAGLALSMGLRKLSVDCSSGLPSASGLQALPGPHLARKVDTVAAYEGCRALGFQWFAGRYPLQMIEENPDDGITRKRLLALLALLASDADVHELEALLKQDPALSFHLLKLVNSAAFALSVPINSFAQAINVLGRRQLQRWLQLLLYARQQVDGLGNPLLPLAALRGAQMEALCRMDGEGRNAQDLAFMTGVFSLLHILLGMPMADITAALPLPAEVQAALLERSGPLGERLALVEQLDGPADERLLAAAGIDTQAWWRSLLQACHWAIQVSRSL